MAEVAAIFSSAKPTRDYMAASDAGPVLRPQQMRHVNSTGIFMSVHCLFGNATTMVVNARVI